MTSYYVIELDESKVAKDVMGPFDENSVYDVAENIDGMTCVAKAQTTFDTP